MSTLGPLRDLLEHRTDLSLTLDEVQQYQRMFDEANWTSPATGLEKRRHILFHLAILVGKLARIEERADHRVETTDSFNDAVADLLVFAAQLASVADVSLQDLYLDRLTGLVIA